MADVPHVPHSGHIAPADLATSTPAPPDDSASAGSAAVAPEAATRNAENDRIVLPPLRADLIVTKQKFEARTYYIIKDPVSLQYFRLTEEDYYLATLFDGKRPFGRVREALLKKFPHIRLEETLDELNERIMRFSQDLAMLRFLGIQGARLKVQYDAARARKKAKPKIYDLVNKLFFMRFTLFDPDRLFTRMERYFRWIWTKTALYISLVLIVAAIVVYFRNMDRVGAVTSHFFSAHNLLLIWITTIIIKSIHELGHGLTCKHFGCEVHQVGLMTLVFTPYFFVNVTDSWVMPNRFHRILVSAAGIYVELILAAIATFLWATVQPGAFQQFLYNVTFIASVSTVLFNANPLMRFDGYYIMTDLIEVPNLQQKSRTLVSQQVNKLLFGSKSASAAMDRLPLPRKRFWLFYIYAVLSYIYGYYVIYKLAVFMAPHLAPLGLEALADWFSGIALFGWVVMPMIYFFKGLHLTRADWGYGGRLRRMCAIAGVAIGIFAILCFIPKRITIQRSISVQMSESDAIRPEMPGFIAKVFVKEGDLLKADDPIAQLTNHDVEETLVESKLRLAYADAALQRAMGLQMPADIVAATKTRDQAVLRLAQAQKDEDLLTLRAKRAGCVVGHDLSRRIGRMLKSGDLFCAVSDLSTIQIRVPLSEHQVRYVEAGQHVTLKATAFPNQTLEGVVAKKPVNFILSNLDPSLSSARNGDVPTAFNREGKEIPTERTFEAIVNVTNRDGILREGMSGHARIYAGTHPFGELVFQSFLDLIKLDFRF